MAASAFLVTLPDDKSGQTLKEGANAFLCWAFDEADALELAADVQTGDVNAPWADGTGTPIVAPADLTGWRFRVRIIDPADGSEVIDVTHTATAQTIDQVGDSLVTLIETTAIDAANYNSGTNVLTVAEGATEDLGDMTLLVNVYPPVAESLKDVDHTEFYSTIVDEGMASADLSVVLVAASPSKVYGAFKA